MSEEKEPTTEELRKRDFNLYSDETIDYALAESEKYISETIVIFRKTNEISFIILSLYIAVIGYILGRLIGNGGNVHLIVIDAIIIVGTAFSLYYLWNNLWEGTMNPIGKKPDIFINDESESFDLKIQLRKLKIERLTFNQNAINENMDENNRRNENIRQSVNVIIITFAIALCIVVFSYFTQICLEF